MMVATGSLLGLVMLFSATPVQSFAASFDLPRAPAVSSSIGSLRGAPDSHLYSTLTSERRGSSLGQRNLLTPLIAGSALVQGLRQPLSTTWLWPRALIDAWRHAIGGAPVERRMLRKRVLAIWGGGCWDGDKQLLNSGDGSAAPLGSSSFGKICSTIETVQGAVAGPMLARQQGTGPPPAGLYGVTPARPVEAPGASQVGIGVGGVGVGGAPTGSTIEAGQLGGAPTNAGIVGPSGLPGSIANPGGIGGVPGGGGGLSPLGGLAESPGSFGTGGIVRM